ncbi:AtpZ/AtpI family protein [Rapidithrix thailandica]|uniref:AtpZ/AtpI family protein n=1 Tax=Rapidithrix thailandica TaxID=413964 RepID=A0AAW9RNW9_9BACT
MTKKEKPNKPPKSPINNKLLRFTGIATEMLGAILLGLWIGGLLDDYWATETPYFTVLFMLLGVAASIWSLMRNLKHFK